MGIHMRDDKSIVYREWAPNAVKAALIGEFSMCWYLPWTPDTVC